MGKFIDGHIERFNRSASCGVMNFTLSFESLIGILTISFAGAIIYVKLIQFQGHAQVRFSSIVVVKYGRGVEDEDIDDDDGDILSSSGSEDENETNKPKLLPCPVLIFRMANLLHSTPKGPIVNAHVKTVATVDIKNAVKASGHAVFKNALNIGTAFVKVYKRNHVYHKYSSRNINNTPNNSLRLSTGSVLGLRKSGKTPNNSLRVSTGSVFNTSSTRSSRKGIVNFLPSTFANRSKSDASFHGLSKLETKNQQIKSSMAHYGVSQEQMELTDEEILSNIMDDEYADDFITSTVREPVPMTGLGTTFVIQKEAHLETPNFVFATIDMDPKSHPYFKTSWRVLHTLNAMSPLLKKAARKKVVQAGGYWPADMNNEDAVRNSIDFDQLLVSFRGLSKATGNEVYGHHVYKMEDLRVGYQFKSILVQNLNGTIGVAPDFIDDIKEQNGSHQKN